MELKTKEEKDAELDRRIEALRKKNQALVRRYQEIEEDKKKAEQEGIAVTTLRKPRPHNPELEKRRQEEHEKRRLEKENFTVTVDLSAPQEKRVVNDKGSPKAQEDTEGPRVQSPTKRMSGRVSRNPRGGAQQERGPREEVSGETPGRKGGRGGRRGRGGETPVGNDRRSKEWEEKRRQNIEKMNQEMEKIAEYERGQRQEGDKPSRHFLDDPRRSGPAPDTDRKEGSRRHVRNWGGLDFDNVKTGAELEKEWTSRRPGPKGSVDMTMSMTGRERAEYLRWKKEREQIDEERLARHRNATGQWRREWDAQKSDSMFTEDQAVGAEGTVSEQSTRRDDGKRPPKDHTFGDFLSQGRTHGPRGERGRGRNRGSRPSYSMHDNRWEAEKEEEERKEKEDKPKQEAEMEDMKSKTPEEPKALSPRRDEPAEDDEDQWEDASDGEEEPEETELHSRSPKEQRTPRLKAHALEPLSPQVSPEAAKPLSPFCPLDHQPVSDWGEEMELLSPRSSMGSESLLKPPSVDASPQQKSDPEEPGTSGGQSEGHPRAQSVAQPEAQSEAQSEGQSETQSEGQSEAQSEGQSEAQSEGQPEAQSEGQPEAQSEGQPEAQSEGQPEAQSEGQPEAQSEGQPEAQSEEQPGGHSEGQPGALLEVAPERHSVRHREPDQPDVGDGATQEDLAVSTQDRPLDQE